MSNSDQRAQPLQDNEATNRATTNNPAYAQGDGDPGSERERETITVNDVADFQEVVTEAFKTGEPFLAGAAAMDQEHILQFFAYEHLPPSLQIVSQPFAELANDVIMRQKRSPERTVALRKLLESKDACVRAALAK